VNPIQTQSASSINNKEEEKGLEMSIPHNERKSEVNTACSTRKASG